MAGDLGPDRGTGFLGVSGECGPNPPLAALDAALDARVATLPPPEGDPFEGTAELMATA